KQLTEFLEYTLFLVDEWLRFRSGDSQASLVVRTILSLIWQPISFVVRFYIVVLIEPGINPLKFPISSVAAKFVYPMLVTLGLLNVQVWSSPFFPPLSHYIGWIPAWIFVVGTFFFLPDAFGFLIWEMKENWSLYRANRGKVVRPAVVGSHG